MVVDLRPHQQTAVDKLGNGKILYGGVGVGKSITAMAYFVSKVCKGTYGDYGSMRTPRDVYVITTAKKRDSLDWEEEANRFGISGNPSNSIAGIKLTVDSWNNIADYKDVENAFFIFDEQRVVGYGAWSKAFIHIAKHNEWILLSATPGDTWMDYIPVFIANGWYKNKTEFTDQHVIWTPRVKYPKVQRYIDSGTLVRRRNQVLVHMPYERTTIRHSVDILCDYDETLFEKAVKKRWHVYEHRPLRDVAELFLVMRKVVNSDVSRLNAVQSLMEQHSRLIVFYNFDYELEELRKLAWTSPASGLSTSPESQPSTTSDGMSKDQTQSDSFSQSSELTAQASTPSEATSESTSPSPGRWTEDEGMGELFIPAWMEPTELGGSQTTGPTQTPRQQKSEKPSKSLPSSTSNLSVSGPKPKGKKLSERGRSPSTSGELHTSSTQQRESSHPEKSLNKSSGKSLITSGSGSKSSSSGTTLSEKTGKSSESKSNLPDSFGTQPQSSSFVVAEWNGHKHEPIPNSARWVYLVQYRAGAEGWNCISTDAICFYSQTYSYRDWWQAHGRIDRMNTPYTHLYYYHLISKSIIDKAIRLALSAKKSFNEKDLAL